jgi:NAD(P)-dependent dehydrogenase (short-subunit alcohol dehydrogenase family)
VIDHHNTTTLRSGTTDIVICSRTTTNTTMPSYAIIGASRGIGYGFLKILSQDPSNIIIGTARDPEPTQAKLAADNLPSNIHILKADLTSSTSLKAAATATANLTGGSLDYFIVNGAYLSQTMTGRFFDEFDDEPDLLAEHLQLNWDTNVVGVIHSINAFLPLIKKSPIKKVFAISSGLADDDLASKYSVWESAGYATSKAALNAVVARYDARYRGDGVLFLSISPGMVDTGVGPPGDSEMPAKFMRYAPHFKGPITVEESVTLMLKVFERAGAGEEWGGRFVSQFGDKQWL